MHTTWTYIPDDGYHYDYDDGANEAMHVYLWWWPVNEMPDYPLNKLQRLELTMELAKVSREDEEARAAASPGASNDKGGGAKFFSGMLQLMERRELAANAFSHAVAFCTASTIQAPLDLTSIQEFIRLNLQGQIPSVFGAAPRGILVVRYLFRVLLNTVQSFNFKALRLHCWQLAMFLCLLQVPTVQSVEYIPLGHLIREEYISTYVRAAFEFSDGPRLFVKEVPIRIIMLPSRQALGVSP